MLWRLVENGATGLVDAAFKRLTGPRKPLEQRLEELDKALASLPQGGEQSTDTTPRPAQVTARAALPSTAETVADLRRRFGKELYSLQGDLLRGCRIAGKPCNCFEKHNLGLEAMAEELLSMGPCDVCHDVLRWVEAHAAVSSVEAVAAHPPKFYMDMAPEVRDLRTALMSTEDRHALLTPREQEPVEALMSDAAPPDEAASRDDGDWLHREPEGPP